MPQIFASMSPIVLVSSLGQGFTVSDSSFSCRGCQSTLATVCTAWPLPPRPVLDLVRRARHPGPQSIRRKVPHPRYSSLETRSQALALHSHIAADRCGIKWICQASIDPATLVQNSWSWSLPEAPHQGPSAAPCGHDSHGPCGANRDSRDGLGIVSRILRRLRLTEQFSRSRGRKCLSM